MSTSLSGLSTLTLTAEELLALPLDGKSIPEGTLEVYISSGTGLAPADINGLSDPYCTVAVLPETKRPVKSKTPNMRKVSPIRYDRPGIKSRKPLAFAISETQYATLNPTWNFFKKFEINKKMKARHLLIQVWDWDRGVSDDFLGQVSLDLIHLLENGYMVPGEALIDRRNSAIQAQAAASKSTGTPVKSRKKPSTSVLYRYELSKRTMSDCTVKGHISFFVGFTPKDFNPSSTIKKPRVFDRIVPQVAPLGMLNSSSSTSSQPSSSTLGQSDSPRNGKFEGVIRKVETIQTLSNATIFSASVTGGWIFRANGILALDKVSFPGADPKSYPEAIVLVCDGWRGLFLDQSMVQAKWHIYDDSILPSKFAAIPSTPDISFWVPDKARNQCAICKAPFTSTRRRHHCRACGCLCCKKCFGDKLLLPERGYGNIGQKCCVSCTEQSKTALSAQSKSSDNSNSLSTSPSGLFHHAQFVLEIPDMRMHLVSIPNLHFNVYQELKQLIKDHTKFSNIPSPVSKDTRVKPPIIYVAKMDYMLIEVGDPIILINKGSYGRSKVVLASGEMCHVPSEILEPVTQEDLDRRLADMEAQSQSDGEGEYGSDDDNSLSETVTSVSSE